MLLLYPNRGVGIFISTNSVGGTALVRNVTNEFTDRYFPATGKPKTISFSKKYLEQFVGTYLSNRRPHKRFTKIAALLFEDKKVTVTDDDQLQTSGNPAITWTPIDSLTFMDLNSDRKIAFRADKKGKIKYLFSSTAPHVVMERTPTLLSKSLHSKLFIVAFGTILLAYFLWIINHIFKWYYKIKDKKDLPASVKKLALANGLFIFAFLIAFSILSGDNGLVFRKRNASDYALLSLPLISLLLTAWQLIKMIGVWKLNNVRIRSRLFYSLVTLAFVGLMWQFYFWNLLGFHF